MEIVTSVNPKISNWQEVIEQFGTVTPIGKNYKTAFEIYKELIFANQRLNLEGTPNTALKFADGITGHLGSESLLTLIIIECERGNPDSAVCMFEYSKMEGEQRVYEYTGTAK